MSPHCRLSEHQQFALCNRHLAGITKRWSAPIYASKITAALCVRRLGVRWEQMIVLPMDVPTEVLAEYSASHRDFTSGADGRSAHSHPPGQHAPYFLLPPPTSCLFSQVQGARVTLIEANHCPGAVLFLFQLQNGRNVLHTGDFRYEPSMCRHPSLVNLPCIDALYLDTTYCEPKHVFPTQSATIAAVVDRCRLLVDLPRTLVLFGSYSIGSISQQNPISPYDPRSSRLEPHSPGKCPSVSGR